MLNWKLIVLAVLATLVSPLAVGADLLVKNVRGITPTETGTEEFSCMTVTAGRVEALGSGEQCDGFEAGEVVDGGGHGLLPGLIDAHGVHQPQAHQPAGNADGHGGHDDQWKTPV